jgi:peptide/nickel transport system permease protein
MYMFILVVILSVVSFIIIQLPPGDFVNSYVMSLMATGEDVSQEEMAAIRKIYGLDLPMYLQYFKWVGNLLRGNFGRSLEWAKPVSELLAQRLPLTIAISLSTLLFTYAVAVPIGIYSATHQYSVGDYTFTVLGFAGLAIPNFLLALVLMFIFYKFFGLSIGGLFSQEYALEPWSMAKFWDMLKHLPVPIIVIGTAQTASIIRVMRGCLLDELQKQYVVTARAKGLKEGRLLFKYPVRMAINPIISTIAWVFPNIFSGGTITAIVLSLPTIGPLMFLALMSQDMYLAGACVMILGTMTFLGAFISDILLAGVDPRIRLS